MPPLATWVASRHETLIERKLDGKKRQLDSKYAKQIWLQIWFLSVHILSVHIFQNNSCNGCSLCYIRARDIQRTLNAYKCAR